VLVHTNIKNKALEAPEAASPRYRGGCILGLVQRLVKLNKTQQNNQISAPNFNKDSKQVSKA